MVEGNARQQFALRARDEVRDVLSVHPHAPHPPPVGRFQSTRGATPRTKALVAGALPLMET
eukprot:6646741-Prymnesium_polylepis.1